jgi:hypothetical protein
LSNITHDPWEENCIAIMFEKSFKTLGTSLERLSLVDNVETAEKSGGGSPSRSGGGSVKRSAYSVDGMQQDPPVPKKKMMEFSEKSKLENR